MGDAAQLDGMSIKELKALIEKFGGRSDDCVEKADLRARARTLMNAEAQAAVEPPLKPEQPALPYERTVPPSPIEEEPPTPKEDDGVDSMSIKELKALIEQKGGRSDDCVEKADLKARARKLMAVPVAEAHPPQPPQPPPPPPPPPPVEQAPESDPIQVDEPKAAEPLVPLPLPIPAPIPDDGVDSMSIKDLKALIERLGGRSDDCVEKADLRARARKLLCAAPPASAPFKETEISSQEVKPAVHEAPEFPWATSDHDSEEEKQDVDSTNEKRPARSKSAKLKQMLGNSFATLDSALEQWLALLKPAPVLTIAAASDCCTVLLSDGSLFDFNGKSATPRALALPPSAGRVIALRAGSTHFIALTDDSLANAYSWGSRAGDWLGRPVGSSTLAQAQDLLGLSVDSGIPASEPGPVLGFHGRVVDASCGSDFTILITSRGKVWGVGSNLRGQLGLDEQKSFSQPVQLHWASSEFPMNVVSNGLHSVALRTEPKNLVLELMRVLDHSDVPYKASLSESVFNRLESVPLGASLVQQRATALRIQEALQAKVTEKRSLVKVASESLEETLLDIAELETRAETSSLLDEAAARLDRLHLRKFELIGTAKITVRELVDVETKLSSIRSRLVLLERCALRLKRHLQLASTKDWVLVSSPEHRCITVCENDWIMFRLDVDAGDVVVIKEVELEGVGISRAVQLALSEDSTRCEPIQPIFYLVSRTVEGRLLRLTAKNRCTVHARKSGHSAWLWVGIKSEGLVLDEGFKVRVNLS